MCVFVCVYSIERVCLDILGPWMIGVFKINADKDEGLS